MKVCLNTCSHTHEGAHHPFYLPVAAVAKKKRGKKAKNNRPQASKAKEKAANDNNSARGRWVYFTGPLIWYLISLLYLHIPVCLYCDGRGRARGALARAWEGITKINMKWYSGFHCDSFREILLQCQNPNNTTLKIRQLFYLTNSLVDWKVSFWLILYALLWLHVLFAWLYIHTYTHTPIHKQWRVRTCYCS